MIFFVLNFSKSVVNRKQPGPQFVISATAPGGNLISASRLSAPVTIKKHKNTLEYP
jgi:hypothetical protein